MKNNQSIKANVLLTTRATLRADVTTFENGLTEYLVAATTNLHLAGFLRSLGS